MTTKEKLTDFLRENNIKEDVDSFINKTSNIYHGYEAENYDQQHFSIKLSIEYWEKAIIFITGFFKEQGDLKVLDYGCGTGFATERIFNSMLAQKVSGIVCYDLSPEMIMQARRKFEKNNKISYLSDGKGMKELRKMNGQFDIVMCNSLLHHILEPEILVKELSSWLKKGGIFIMGHEPNKVFYESSVLAGISHAYRFYKKIRNRLARKMEPSKLTNVDVLTRDELIREGVIKENFDLRFISKFVDIHVPMSSFSTQPWGELGFNAEYIHQHSENRLKVLKQYSYNHIKDQQAYKSLAWRIFAKWLSFLYPEKGADTILLFQKVD